VVREGLRFDGARFFALFRAGAALRAALAFFVAADLRGPRRLRAGAALRAGPRLRVGPRLRALAFRLLFFLAEVVRLREPLILFLPAVEPPRDDFLAAAMI